MNASDDQTIQVPEVLRGLPVAACRFRKRTLKSLADYRLLGELQGLRYDRLFDLARPEGARSARTLCHRIADLEREAASRQAAWERMAHGGAQPGGGTQPDALDWLLLEVLLKTVPARCDYLAVRLIPHAACINAFLERNAIATFGQLKTFDFLGSNWGIGRLKLKALINLARQAQDDALQEGIADEREAARLLVSFTDAYLKRPGRDDANRMLGLRMLGAGPDDRPWTLERIGQKYGLTRERVRQIIYENQVPGLANAGGMRLHKALDCLAAFCETHTLPVTEARFAGWLGSAPHDHPCALYLALADALVAPGRLPVWAETPMANDGRVRQVIQTRHRLERLRLETGRPMKLTEVFGLLQGKRQPLSRKIFLAALRNHPAFEVDPETGTLTRHSGA